MLSKAVVERLRSRRRIWLVSFDCGVWAVGLALAAIARMEFEPAKVSWPAVCLAWGFVTSIYLVAALSGGIHTGRARLASLEEMVTLGLVTAGSGGLLFAVNLAAAGAWLPRSVPFTGAFITLTLMAGGRATYRVLEEAGRVTPAMETSQPVLILGAGDGGRQLIRSMHRDASAQWRPVALVDDDPLKRSLRLDGVPVMGTSNDIAEVAERSGATVLVVAIPSAGADLVRKVTQTAQQTGLVVKVLPGVNDLMSGFVGINDLRDLDVADLLGRHQVETDVASIASYLTGQRVLVTGAGGSIGSELCRQIHKWGPAKLVMLDRDESALHALQLSIHGEALLTSSDIVLADIRDRDAIEQVFAEHRPQVVFHAAALKHLPVLERHPGEAIKTNVWGTQIILDAARTVQVERFVNISTDKAANPCSVLGYTKRIAERLTAGVAAATSGTYLSVRFGNVLGSRGSVLTSFTSQIASGGPLTVTHPEVTRFFMTVQEAVQLVIQAAAIGSDGEALVLDMGRPVKIDDVARQMIAMSGRVVDVRYTGLRHGEKMHEVLMGTDEVDVRPVHPLVSHVSVPEMQTATAWLLDPQGPPDRVIGELEAVCHQVSTGLRPSRQQNGRNGTTTFHLDR